MKRSEEKKEKTLDEESREETGEYDAVINLKEGGTMEINWNYEEGFRYYRGTEPGKYTYTEIKPRKKFLSEGEYKSISISAYPNKGWRFDRWTGDYEGTDKEIHIDPDSDIEVTAHFKKEFKILESNMEKKEEGIEITGVVKHTPAKDRPDTKKAIVRAGLFNEKDVKLVEGTTTLKRIGPGVEHWFKIDYFPKIGEEDIDKVDRFDLKVEEKKENSSTTIVAGENTDSGEIIFPGVLGRMEGDTLVDPVAEED